MIFENNQGNVTSIESISVNDSDGGKKKEKKKDVIEKKLEW